MGSGIQPFSNPPLSAKLLLELNHFPFLSCREEAMEVSIGLPHGGIRSRYFFDPCEMSLCRKIRTLYITFLLPTTEGIGKSVETISSLLATILLRLESISLILPPLIFLCSVEKKISVSVGNPPKAT
jgi:hypothetical protein